MNGPDELEIESIALSRGGRVLFRELSLTVRAGEFLSLEGPNGAGKTSLLRTIAGFIDPDAGTIRLRTNGSLLSDPEDRAPRMGWLGHKDGVKAQMTPRELLQFFQRFAASAGDIDKMLSAVGLSRAADLPVQYLSTGQKRRLALARLRMIPRPLWLLDEPLAALDGEGKAIVTETISAHCRAGGLAIAATHEALGLEGNRVVLAGHLA